MLNLSKKIVVAIDGSPQSDKAAEEAVRMATISRGRVKSRIYAVLVLPKSDAPAVDSLAVPDDRMVSDHESIRKQMFYVIEKAAREAEIGFESVIAYGDPAEEIIRVAEERECDVIVIGSSGKGRVKRALQGSVSIDVALHAHVSVYVVR
ncbi:MAG: universal stress protein [Desulfuromonas sp.]|nr:MAG: universal stress protein [Desulfuromonas sp.]